MYHLISASRCIDDFELRSKMYEGHLSCVVKAMHKPSRRMVAIKIYKRSRLHAMERQQVRHVTQAPTNRDMP